MKVHLCNGKSVIIPDHILNFSESGPTLSDNCSWAADFLRKNKPPKFSDLRGVESMRKLSMIRLTECIKGQYSSYMEPFGGAGIHAKLLEGIEYLTYVNDIDKDCLEILKLNFPNGEVWNVDLIDETLRRSFLSIRPDFMFIDSNNFTLNSMHNNKSSLYKDLTLDGFTYAKKFLAINDCSSFYLKYGPRSLKKYSELLGVTLNSLEEYYKALPEYWNRLFPEWHLVKIVHFGVSSHQLFQRTPAPLELIKLSADDLKNNPVIGRIEYNESPDSTLSVFK